MTSRSLPSQLVDVLIKMYSDDTHNVNDWWIILIISNNKNNIHGAFSNLHIPFISNFPFDVLIGPVWEAEKRF
jgi:hypothetical protein